MATPPASASRRSGARYSPSASPPEPIENSRDDTHHAIPDIGVVCGREKPHPLDEDLVVNPSVLIEVLSTSTYKRDHVDKRLAYTAISSLRAYVVIDQYQPVVTLWSRGDGGWDAEILGQGRLDIPGTELHLDLDALYAAP